MRANVVVLVHIASQAEYYPKAIRALDPELTVTSFRARDDALKVMPEADILLSFGSGLGPDFFRDARRIKWVHALGTGLDGIIDSQFLYKRVLVTATRGIHGIPMSEAAIMMMLTLARDFRRTLRQQEARQWQFFFAQLLHGKTVGILGIGAIASHVAERCKAMGMTVVGITRTVRDLPGFDRMVGREDLLRIVPELDFLILLIPHDADSHHIVDARVLAAMKPTSFLINLARGGVIDETALVAALGEKRIAGAALDAYEHEPLPPDNPLWELPNVICSPHMTGAWDGYAEACFQQFAFNYRQFVAGHPERMTYLEPRR
jgi:phosphoglycerate dehydrogenase-like enzyme